VTSYVIDLASLLAGAGGALCLRACLKRATLTVHAHLRVALGRVSTLDEGSPASEQVEQTSGGFPQIEDLACPTALIQNVGSSPAGAASFPGSRSKGHR
jgi:hypothetical protein